MKAGAGARAGYLIVCSSIERWERLEECSRLVDLYHISLQKELCYLSRGRH